MCFIICCHSTYSYFYPCPARPPTPKSNPQAIQTVGKFWQRRVCLSVNHGGLSSCVFLLTRTATAWVAPAAAVVLTKGKKQPESSASEASTAETTSPADGSGDASTDVTAESEQLAQKSESDQVVEAEEK